LAAKAAQAVQYSLSIKPVLETGMPSRPEGAVGAALDALAVYEDSYSFYTSKDTGNDKLKQRKPMRVTYKLENSTKRAVT